jgi:hypothetical protein
MDLGGSMTWSTSISRSMSKSRSSSMCWSRSCFMLSFGFGDKIYGRMELTELDIMIV